MACDVDPTGDYLPIRCIAWSSQCSRAALRTYWSTLDRTRGPGVVAPHGLRGVLHVAAYVPHIFTFLSYTRYPGNATTHSAEGLERPRLSLLNDALRSE